MVAIYVFGMPKYQGTRCFTKINTLISKHSSNAIVIKIIWGERSTLTNQDVSWHVEQCLFKTTIPFSFGIIADLIFREISLLNIQTTVAS